MLKLLGIIVRNVLWVGLTGAVLAGGYFGFTSMRDNRDTLEPVPVSQPSTAVQTEPLRPWVAPLPVRGEGFVTAERSVSLSTLAGGEIVYLHPSLASEDGRFAKDDILVRIDDAAEQANLRKADADIAAAQSQLALDRVERERMQSLFGRGLTPQKTLDEIEAQVAASEYRLEGLMASKAALEVAVANKVVRAPFDGAILSNEVETGAIVSPGQTMAEAFTDESLAVVVNLGEAEAALIPGLFDGANAEADVRIAFAGTTYAASGKVTKVAPALDTRTRTLAVTVSLDGADKLQPVAGPLPASGAPPALINAFAEVEIYGATEQNTYLIPSTAVHSGNIWLADGRSLRLVPVKRLHVDGGNLFVAAEDIPDNARLVVSTIAVPVDGMAIEDVSRVAVSEAQVPDSEDETP
ncbi:MAG: efflux RND transporter periplasmic adaptor subunit [Alphaproteobacteria bacterium]|nr:efflux RND transporter periplasmic adaptor subunit [Alphaproteobacteria bacterium]